MERPERTVTDESAARPSGKAFVADRRAIVLARSRGLSGLLLGVSDKPVREHASLSVSLSAPVKYRVKEAGEWESESPLVRQESGGEGILGDFSSDPALLSPSVFWRTTGSCGAF